MGDYLGEESIQLSMELAKEYAPCGHDEIRLCLFDLICSSLYVWIEYSINSIDNTSIMSTRMGFASSFIRELLSKW